MRHYSAPAAVNIVAGKPVGRVEVGDALAQFPLLPLQPLGFAFARGKIDEEPFYQRRDRRVPLGRDHTRPPVGFFIQ